MIKINVLADVEAAINNIDKLQKQTNDKLNKMAAQGSSAFNSLGKAAVYLNQGLELVNKGFSFFTKAVSAGVKASVDQEEAINDMNQAMRASGTFTNKASQEIQDFSAVMQKNSVFAGEVILKASALGVTLGKLEGQQLKDATLAAANMASALGIDLDSAMQKIVKSSIDGGTGLKKFGIAVEKGVTGADTLTNAITKINEQFAGAAASKILTYKGAVDQAKNTFGDMLEKIGEFITKNPLVVKIVNIANAAFQKMADVIGSFSPQPLNDLVSK